MAGFGETLRQARAHKNVTLREAEADTRINRHYLAALEDEEFDALPPPIYSRGIVRKYADYLELDAGKVLDMHRELMGTPHEPMPSHATPTEMPRMWAPNFAIMAFAAVLAAILFAWGYSIWLSPVESVDSQATATSTTSLSATETAQEARPTPPAAPTEIPTEEVVIQSGGDNQSGTEAGATVYRTGIGVTVTADTHVTIQVDGQTAFDDVLAAGESTDMLVGSDFSVTTDDGSASFFFNSCGLTSEQPMDAEPEPFSFSFSASERSCAPPDES